MKTAAYIKQLTSLEPDLARRRLGTLTPRQREVFDLMIAGTNTRAIATILKISPKTLDIHRADVLAKLHAKSWQDLVWYEVASRLAADLPDEIPVRAADDKPATPYRRRRLNYA